MWEIKSHNRVLAHSLILIFPLISPQILTEDYFLFQ